MDSAVQDEAVASSSSAPLQRNRALSRSSVSIAQEPPPDPRKNFDWLEKGTAGITYTSYTAFLRLPATSFDFGQNGFTGSCNRGGELLQVTAPSASCGFISARGDFADTPDSILARSQRVRAGKSAFGLKVVEADDSDYVLSHRPVERGTFNFRWPLVEYRLMRRGFESGTCSLFSYVEDGVLYQIMRLLPMASHHSSHRVAITVGGPIRFGCRCQGLSPQDYEVTHDASGCVRLLRNACLPSQALAMQLFVDGEPVILEAEEGSSSEVGTEGGAAPEHRRATFGDIKFSMTQELKPGKATIVVAAFRFSSPESAVASLKYPSSTDLYQYVGVGVECENATDWLWREKLDNNAEKAEFNSYYTEICLVGRCLERLLYSNYVLVDVGSEEYGQGCALLDSVMANPRVDFQSFFWQIRFLIQVHDYLKDKWTIPTDSRAQLEAQISRTLHVRDKRLKKIRRHIYRALVFLLHVDVKRGWLGQDLAGDGGPHHTHTPCDEKERWKLYYITITVWYVLKVCPEALQPNETLFLELLAKRLDSLVKEGVPDDEADLGSANGVKAHILRWFHHESTLKIRQYMADNEVKSYSTSQRASQQQRLEHCRRAAQKAMMNKIRAEQPYTASDEPCDRLSFISIESELGFETDPKNPTSCITLSTKRIYDRDWTTTVNPAVIPADYEGSQIIPRSPPWETNSLCHHAHMLIWRDVDPDETEPYRIRCYEFLTAEVSLVECWERGNTDALLSWFRIEATCVLATTLVLIRKKRLLATASGSNRGSGDDKKLPSSQRGGTESQPDASEKFADDGAGTSETPLHTSQVYDSQGFSTIPFRPRRQDSFNRDTGSVSDIWKKQLDALHSLLDAFRQSNPSYGKVDWKAYRPATQYHPDAFVNSRDDTPELFTDSKLAKITLRSQFKRYLGSKIAGPHIPATVTTAAERVPVDVLHYVSVVDIVFGQAVGSGYTCRTTGRLSPDTIAHVHGAVEVPAGFNLLNVPQTGLSTDSDMLAIQAAKSADEMIVTVSAAFLDEQFIPTDGALPIITKDLKQDYEQLLVRFPPLKDYLNNKLEVNKARKKLHSALTRVLDDSLVDQKVHFRFHIVRRESWQVARELAYVWHPESLDTCDDHFGNLCQFRDSRKTSWITTVTLLHWSLMMKPVSPEDQSKMSRKKWKFPVPFRRRTSVHTHMKTGPADPKAPFPFPPEDIDDFLGQEHWAEQFSIDPFQLGRFRPHLKLNSSSIVISTSPFGDFGKCTVLSRALNEVVHLRLSKTVTEISNAFIHQPHTARCLIFVIYLGALCDAIGAHYEDILKCLDKPLGLGDSILKDGLFWIHGSTFTVEHLRVMVWAQETFRVFRNGLLEALEKISDARQAMLGRLAEGPGRRHDYLERICQSTMEDFDKQCARLQNLSVKFEQKIEQISRSHDGESSVTNVQDSQTAIKQGNNIRVLTFITIAYAPLSFVTALFAIPDSQFVVRDGVGLGWFLGILFILLFATFFIAAILESVLGYMARVWEALNDLARPNRRTHAAARLRAPAYGVDPHGLGIALGRRKSSTYSTMSSGPFAVSTIHVANGSKV